GAVTTDRVRGGAVPLITLLPPDLRDPSGWILLDASGGRRRLEVPDPARRYPGHEARVYLSPAGALALGIFPRGAPPTTAPVLELTPIDRIAIHTRLEPEAAPASPTLALSVAGKPVRTLTASDLEGLPTAGDRPSQWRLLDIAGLATDPARIATIIVVGDDGQRASFDRAALTAPDAPILRLNRRNALRLDRLTTSPGTGSGDGTGSDAAFAIRVAARLDLSLH
ncbi:MAG TPA: hypothetical protein VMZ28_01165, partial [Kofleriaceae bacterium]|nr:hypothetical protein [Kofleriaceae bacterium]